MARKQISTPVEKGQSGSYGTDRLRDPKPGPGVPAIDTNTPEHARARSEGNSAIGNSPVMERSRKARNKVDVGATPSLGSSPSRQR
ncbi:MAG: hypothetical protein ABI343_09500 [Burkholderiaceae bacterium]